MAISSFLFPTVMAMAAANPTRSTAAPPSVCQQSGTVPSNSPLVGEWKVDDIVPHFNGTTYELKLDDIITVCDTSDATRVKIAFPRPLGDGNDSEFTVPIDKNKNNMILASVEQRNSSGTLLSTTYLFVHVKPASGSTKARIFGAYSFLPVALSGDSGGTWGGGPK